MILGWGASDCNRITGVPPLIDMQSGGREIGVSNLLMEAPLELYHIETIYLFAMACYRIVYVSKWKVRGFHYQLNILCCNQALPTNLCIIYFLFSIVF